MIRFLIKGVLRDRSRSLFPMLIVTAGVFLTVATYCYVKGAEINMVRSSANLRHGHVKVMTAAYAAEADQVPNDAALTGVTALTTELKALAPEMDWVARIEFGGLLDVPDAKGETKVQAPAAGIAVDLRTPGSPERALLGLDRIIVRGRQPQAADEILLGDVLARRLGLEPGGRVTLIGSTMHGAMSMTNFVVAGTIRFGMRAMDQTGLIADLTDIRKALDMEDAAGEVLGLFRSGIFNPARTEALTLAFNARPADPNDAFRPVMQPLQRQPGLDYMFQVLGSVGLIIILVFLLAMSLVQWNAGLIGTLRRYGEFGLRLALGESKGRAYRSLLAEAVVIGILGSIIGTALGLALSYYLQVHGLDVSGMMKNLSFLMDPVLRSKITPFAYIIGFIPGLLASVIGTAIAGRAVYRRQTASLFKELES
ncbi:MAG: FtsX-like permease family protein [Candidatus Aminicenantes bacterium]|nr:FtsX-like permease family protein [Candidatus Aminicenantes bacterium]